MIKPILAPVLFRKFPVEAPVQDPGPFLAQASEDPPCHHLKIRRECPMQTETPATPRLEIKGIRKVYPSVIANDGIDLTVMPGEIHAVLGRTVPGSPR